MRRSLNNKAMGSRAPGRRSPLGEVALAWLVCVAAVGCAPELEPAAPPEQLRDCGRFVFYDSEGERPTRVSVIGDFNDWRPGVDLMVDDDGDGVYAARLELPPGQHRYRIEVDGRDRLDRLEPQTAFDEVEREHSLMVVPDCREPDWVVEPLELDGRGGVRAVLHWRRADSGAALDAGRLSARLSPGGQPVAVEAEPSTGRVVFSAEGLPVGKHRLVLEGRDTLGRAAEPVSLPFWVEETPFDWRDAIIYQVFVDRFRAATGPLPGLAPISWYHGGDLWGVIDMMEAGYFEALGVNALWISPMVDNPEGRFVGRDGHVSEAYHGYWPSDPMKVEPRFGGEDALEALVEAAHSRGIRVLMDMVFNHVHDQHPYSERGAAWFNNPDGECICGRSCPWATHIEECWFDPFLMDLRVRNPAVIETLVDDAEAWVTRYDLDGLRMDAVPMMPRMALRRLRARLDRRLGRGGLHFYLLGETFTSRGQQPLLRYYLGPHTLSGQFDFPVMWALRESLSGGQGFGALDIEVQVSEASWRGTGAVMAPFLGNHDVPRFISAINGDRTDAPRVVAPALPQREAPFELLKMGWAFVLTQPGAPVIYYGDEVGMPGANDPDNRRDMIFGEGLTGDQREVLTWTRRLGALRRCSAALRRGARQTIVVDDDLYVYGRDAGDGHPVMVVLNRAAEPAPVTVTVPEGWALDAEASWRDMLGAALRVEDRQISLVVPPATAAVLVSNCGGL